MYRPVGLRELELVAASGYRGFPPRLQPQPIFYVVLTYSYAEAIARKWNTVDATSGYAGFVTSFDLNGSFATRYEERTVGGRDDRELWIPAEELPAFNEQILGEIVVEASFYGEGFSGTIDDGTQLPLSVLSAKSAV